MFKSIHLSANCCLVPQRAPTFPALCRPHPSAARHLYQVIRPPSRRLYKTLSLRKYDLHSNTCLLHRNTNTRIFIRKMYINFCGNVYFILTKFLLNINIQDILIFRNIYYST